MNRRTFLRNIGLVSIGMLIKNPQNNLMAAEKNIKFAQGISMPRNKLLGNDNNARSFSPKDEVIANGMTADFLRNAFGGESMAYTRYLLWSDHATQSGYPNIGRLYKAIAYAEYVHAGNHFCALKENTGGYTVHSPGEFGCKSVTENLVWAIEGERGEVEQMYPVYLNAAEYQEEYEAAVSFHYALEAEKIHIRLFSEAYRHSLKNEDISLKDDKIYICPTCGFTHVGEHEDQCPVCLAESKTFRAY